MSDDIVERVALAISGSNDPHTVLGIHRTRARLAIEAMRKPTDEIERLRRARLDAIEECARICENGGWVGYANRHSPTKSCALAIRDLALPKPSSEG